MNNDRIDLHGYSVEEALIKANNDINDAYFSQTNKIVWITGTGKINKSLLELVRNNYLIDSVLNDGILGHVYNGLVAVELHTIRGG